METKPRNEIDSVQLSGNNNYERPIYVDCEDEILLQFLDCIQTICLH